MFNTEVKEDTESREITYRIKIWRKKNQLKSRRAWEPLSSSLTKNVSNQEYSSLDLCWAELDREIDTERKRA